MKEYEEILNTKIDTNIDDIKAESSSSINQTFSPIDPHYSHYSSNQPSADINKWPLLKSPDFHSHDSHFTKNLPPMNLKGDTLLQLKNGGITFVLPYTNLCQQIISGHHTRNSKQKITTSPNFSSHHTLILNIPQEKNNIKHSQEHSEFILLNISTFNRQRQKKHV